MFQQTDEGINDNVIQIIPSIKKMFVPQIFLFIRITIYYEACY